MSKGTIIGLSAAGFLALVTVMMIFAGVGLYNGAVKSEKGVEAQYEQNQNNLSQYSNKVAEAAQIPAMYRDDFSKVVTDALTGPDEVEKYLDRNPDDAGAYYLLGEIFRLFKSRMLGTNWYRIFFGFFCWHFYSFSFFVSTQSLLIG